MLSLSRSGAVFCCRGRLLLSLPWTNATGLAPATVCARSPMTALSPTEARSQQRFVATGTASDSSRVALLGLSPRAMYLVKPESISFYTGNSKYYDLLVELRGRLGSDHADKVRAVRMNVERFEEYKPLFKTLEQMKCDLDLHVSPQMHAALLHHLLAIYEDNKGELCPLLCRFAAEKNITRQIVYEPPELDENGIAHTFGRSKKAKAFAQVLLGTGEFKVNGVDVGNYFNRRTAVEEAIFPLQAAKSYDKYNIWVVAQGGGVMGQAEAVRVAVSRGIAMHDKGVLQDLRDANTIEIDRRKTERKKPGQPKARKKWRWVRR